MIWIVLMLVACAGPAPDPCEDWTWLDHEGCAADVCGQEWEAEAHECRDGACWCCTDDVCWEG